MIFIYSKRLMSRNSSRVYSFSLFPYYGSSLLHNFIYCFVSISVVLKWFLESCVLIGYLRCDYWGCQEVGVSVSVCVCMHVCVCAYMSVCLPLKILIFKWIEPFKIIYNVYVVKLYTATTLKQLPLLVSCLNGRKYHLHCPIILVC